MAVRREVIDDGRWRTLLSHGLCEDTGLIEPLRYLGLSYLFRPELLVVDRHDDIIIDEHLSHPFLVQNALLHGTVGPVGDVHFKPAVKHNNAVFNRSTRNSKP